MNFEFKNKLLLEFIDTYTKPRIKIQESFMTAIRGELSSLISTVKSFSDWGGGISISQQLHWKCMGPQISVNQTRVSAIKMA